MIGFVLTKHIVGGESHVISVVICPETAWATLPNLAGLVLFWNYLDMGIKGMERSFSNQNSFLIETVSPS